MGARDEESRLRLYFRTHYLTYFQHGGVWFGESGLSLGLALRPVVHTRLVDKVTGQLVIDPEQRARSRNNDKVLERYMSDSRRKKWNEFKLQRLYLAMKDNVFGSLTKLDNLPESKYFFHFLASTCSLFPSGACQSRFLVSHSKLQRRRIAAHATGCRLQQVEG